MKNCELVLTELNDEDESELGSSHILGCPDVPESWNDNAIFYNDEIFVGQINLKDVDIEGLPKTGILYFFFASESRPYRGIVRYYDGNEQLERVDFNVDIPWTIDLNQEYKISFQEITNNNGIKIFSEKPNLTHYQLDENDVVLLEFNTSLYKKLAIFGKDEQIVCFLIKKEDLKKRDFSKAFLSYQLDE